jgi:hypothetical protein
MFVFNGGLGSVLMMVLGIVFMNSKATTSLIKMGYELQEIKTHITKNTIYSSTLKLQTIN